MTSASTVRSLPRSPLQTSAERRPPPLSPLSPNVSAAAPPFDAFSSLLSATAHDDSPLISPNEPETPPPTHSVLVYDGVAEAVASSSSPYTAAVASAMTPPTHRALIAAEILSTEETYVDSLGALLSCYIQPLLNVCRDLHRRILSEEQIASLSSNISAIALFNGKFLSDLSQRVDQWSAETKIGDLFIEFAHYFAMYTVYVANHDSALALLTTQLDSNGKFQTFCNQTQTKRARVKNMPMNALLIMPVQRIPRYQLLLQQMLKHTESTHCDYANLVSAVNIISATNRTINDDMKMHKQHSMMETIQSLLAPSQIQLIQANRRFIRQGQLTKHNRSNSATQLQHFILFNDLLIAVEKNAFGRFVLKRSIPIDDKFKLTAPILKTTAVAGSSSAPANQSNGASSSNNSGAVYAFTIETREKSLELSCPEEASRRGWIQDIQLLLDERANKTKRTKHKEPNTTQTNSADATTATTTKAPTVTKRAATNSVVSAHSTSHINAPTPVTKLPADAMADDVIRCALCQLRATATRCRRCERECCDECASAQLRLKTDKPNAAKNLCDDCVDEVIKKPQSMQTNISAAHRDELH